MKIGIYKNTLLKPLDRLSKLVSSRSSLPILDCVRVEYSNDKLNLVAGNDGTKMSITVEAVGIDGDSNVGFCVDLNTFQDALKKMPDIGLSLELKENNEIELDFNTGKLSLPVFDIYEYPAMEVECGESILIEESLTKNIDKAFRFSADDELRPVLNGVFFDTIQGNIVGTDGHSLYVSNGLPINGNVKPFILTKDAQKAVKGLSNYTIGSDDRNACIQGDNFMVVTRLIEGNFPNYKSIIPQNNIEYIIDRETFLNAIDRSMIATDEATSLCAIEMDENAIDVKTKDLDSNKSFKETIPCNGDQPGIVGLKGSLATLCLKSIDTDMVLFTYTDKTRAVVFKPINDVEHTSPYKELILLMPMMI